MDAISGKLDSRAIRSAVQVVSEFETTDQTVSDDEQWFAEVARRLLPKDAGLALHVLTGFEERTCYRYAAGDRKVPGYFLRKLLHTDQGWTWLCGFMDGCDAEWWRAVQRAQRIADAIDKVE